MKLTQQQKDAIQLEFTSCKSIEELVSLLNKINDWRHANPYWNLSKQEITVQNLKYFLYGKKDKYRSFEIPKKSGGKRKITAPHQFLNMVQRLLNICFQVCFTPMPTATGFVEGRSIVDNAQKHVGKKYVYNLDVKDFFPSISFHRVRAMLAKVPPFKLNDDIAHIVANLCCHENSLPQGAATSPVLSNFVCRRLDAKFYHFSQKGQFFTFSRYADDITISSNKNIFSDAFKKEVARIIEEEGFALNEKKERLQRYNVKQADGSYIRERQEVTGIVVNEKTNVSRTYLRNLRAVLHNWKKEGYEVANAKHQLYYVREKAFLKYGGNIPALEEVIGGRIEYLGMVRGKEDDIYRLMKLQFDELCMKQDMTAEDFMHVFDLFEKEGVKKAADYFYNRRNVKENG
jgi:RNA-directed DNA polymerase